MIASTHPAVTNVVGRPRRSGLVEVPAAATVTDFGVHPLWALTGIDLHLVMHECVLRRIELVAGARDSLLETGHGPSTR